MYVIWLVPCAVAPNIGTMLVSRFLDGFAGSAFLSVAGGTVGDMFAKNELSLPVCESLLIC
jgi:predicted MFS family arabinose efflux permease